MLAEDQSGEPVEIAYDENAPTAAFVFKTIADPFVGKMSFIKVISGTLKANTEYVNTATGAPEKIGKLYSLCGKKQSEITEASAGDIAVAVKINAGTSDTICAAERKVKIPAIDFPQPCYRMAVYAKAQGDESVSAKKTGLFGTVLIPLQKSRY